MSKKISVYLIIFTVLIFYNFSYFMYAETLQDTDYKEGELIVRFAPKASGGQRMMKEKNTTLSSFNGGTVKHSYRMVPGLTLIQLPNGAKVKDKMNLFKNRPEFLYVEPNYKLYLNSTNPNDTRFNYQWNMHNIGQSHPKDVYDGGGMISGTIRCGP